MLLPLLPSSLAGLSAALPSASEANEAAIRNNIVTTRLGLDLLGIHFSGPQAELLACFCEDVRARPNALTEARLQHGWTRLKSG